VCARGRARDLFQPTSFQTYFRLRERRSGALTSGHRFL
jgi:hypothetical protein